MAEFNPDEYLKQNDDFDPDAYLSESNQAEKYNDAASLGLQALNSAASDYGPNIVSAVKNMSVSSPEYISDRDKYNKNLEEMQNEDPSLSYLGKGVGMIAPALIPVGAAAKAVGLGAKGIQESGMIAKLLKSAATGAAIGAAQDTPDIAGVATSPLDSNDLETRGYNAATGAIVGPAAEGVGKLVSAVTPNKISQGFKAFGPYKKQFKEARIAGETGRLGSTKDLVDFARKEKILSPFSSAEDLYDRTKLVKENYGEELSDVYEKANNQLKSMSSKSGVETAILNPKYISDNLSNEISDTFKFTVGREQAVNKLKSYFDQFGDIENLSILDLHKIKTNLGREADFVKLNPDTSATEKVFKLAERRVDSIIKNQVNHIAENTIEKDLGKRLLDANKNFSLSSKIDSMISNRLDSEGAEYQINLGEILQNMSVAPRVRSTLSSIGANIEKIPNINPQMLSVPGISRNLGPAIAPLNPFEIDRQIKNDPSLPQSEKAKLRNENRKQSK